MSKPLDKGAEHVAAGRGAPDGLAFRKALGRFATGVTVVSTQAEDIVHGMTANGFMSVSLEPQLVLVSIATKSRIHDLLAKSGRYGVSILGSDQEPIARHFAGRPNPDIEIAFDSVDGVPVISGAVAYVTATLWNVHEAGDHSLFLGEVEHLGISAGAPLIFHSGAFDRLFSESTDESHIHWLRTSLEPWLPETMSFPFGSWH